VYVTYRPDIENLLQLIINIGPDYERHVIPPIVKEAVLLSLTDPRDVSATITSRLAEYNII
jgi:hypothetical protein